MNPKRLVLIAAASSTLFVASWSAGAESSNVKAAKPREDKIVDFTDFRREKGKVVLRPYEYAYGDWDKHVIELVDRGVLVQASTGKGGIAENSTQVRFRDYSALALYFSIGNANQAQAIGLMLEDADGTQQSWQIRLAGRPSGQPMRLRLHLDKPDSTDNPGKRPGLDLAAIKMWQLKGDWSDRKVEVLLIRLSGEKEPR